MINASDHFDLAPPVLVKVEAPELDLGHEHLCERIEAAMKAQGRSHRVNKRRFVEYFAITEKTRISYMSPPPVQFDLSPVISRLKDHFTVGRRLKFNDHEAAVLSQGQKIYLVRKRSELVVDR